MSETTDVLETYIDRINRLENELKQEKDNVKNCCRALCFGDVKDMDYDEMKVLMNKIEKYMSSDQLGVFQSKLFEKKCLEYPACRQATWFPEINQLDISDEEKRRLDVVAHSNFRYYINPSTLYKYPMMKKGDIEKLYSVGVLEKYICFNHNNRCIRMISEERINGLKEIWRLHNESNLSTEDSNHFYELLEKYGCDIYLLDESDCDCDGDDWEYEITSLEEYEAYEAKSEKYRVCKEPDTKYDNL